MNDNNKPGGVLGDVFFVDVVDPKDPNAKDRNLRVTGPCPLPPGVPPQFPRPAVHRRKPTKKVKD